ncbi:hypothetical protein IW138_006088 [Coemansia sp. RSA 986]|nr:hypothetical protein IW138_006088 [Coemansia sp. RSA 986]
MSIVTLSSASVYHALTLLGLWLVAKIVSRAYISPLWKIPGPIINSFTNIPLKYNIVRGQYHTYALHLHAMYGEVVRVGYNQVSVSNLAELRRILSTHEFRKGESYDKVRILPPSTLSATDPAINKTRRRQLGNTYSLPSIRLYEDAVLRHGVLSLMRSWDSAIAEIESRNAKAQDGQKTLVNFYYSFHGMAFDVIGTLGFGKSFGIVDSGNTKPIDAAYKTLTLGVLKATLPFGNKIHWIFRDLNEARNYTVRNARMAIEQRRTDISSAKASYVNRVYYKDILQRLVDARDPFTGEPLGMGSLTAEISLMLLAGAGTVTYALSWTLMYLLYNREVYCTLKRHLRTEFPDKNEAIRYDAAKTKLPYLTAVIYESMRMHTVVSNYMPRRVPDVGGAHLLDGEYFLPPGTEIDISLGACHRNPSIWKDPNTFNPERFMGPDAEERIKDVLWFSSGVRICVGRHLALMEIYSTLANILRRYDIELPDSPASNYATRSFFSPLCKIPGPFVNSFTNIPLNHSTTKGTYHKYVQRLHEKYGEIVRVGHNQVSISNLAELKRILSTHDFPKGSLYENMVLPATTIVTTDPELNKIRRRQLGNQYSMPCVRSYEDKILEHGVLSLMQLWDSRMKQVPGGQKVKANVNFYLEFHSMSFDIISVLGFGKSFNILHTGDTTMIERVRKTNTIEVVQSSLPFGEYTHKLFRDLNNARRELRSISKATVLARKGKNNPSHVDILQRLVNARDPLSGKHIDLESMTDEVLLLLIVGTDTTSNTLSWTTLYLLYYPDVYERLKREVRSTFTDKGATIRYDMARAKLPYLTAVVYESMRLHTIVSGYLPRRVPDSGAHVMDDKYFLPQGTEVCISLYPCHRNKMIWKNPNKFDPERFMGPDAEDRIRDVLAFSSGVRICVGRSLALVELFTTLANLIHKYDFALPDDMVGRYASVDDIPGEAFFNYAPKVPKKDCCVVVSPAN